MKHPRIFLMIMLTAALIILMCPIHADTGTQAVLYQSDVCHRSPLDHQQSLN